MSQYKKVLWVEVNSKTNDKNNKQDSITINQRKENGVEIRFTPGK